MLSCHVRPKRLISFIVGDENPKPVHGIELDRKPGSSCSRTLTMQADCFPQQKEVTLQKWTELLFQCSLRLSPTLRHTHTQTHRIAVSLSVFITNAFFFFFQFLLLLLPYKPLLFPSNAILMSHFIREAYSWKWGWGEVAREYVLKASECQ